MAFDSAGFSNVQVKPRTAEVDASALSEWFEEGENCVFVVRGLTGIELAQVATASRQAEVLREMMTKLAAGDAKEKADMMAAQMGLGNDKPVPDAYDQSIERVTCGLIEPKLDRNTIVKLFDSVPAIAYECQRKIQELTEQGADVGKPKRSTKIKKSEAS